MIITRRLLMLAPAVLVLGGVAAAKTRRKAPTRGRRSAAAPSAREAARSLAPSGTLRVAINLGNPVLAMRDATGQLAGTSVVLARELARRLQLPVELVPFNEALGVFEGLDKGSWDVAFLAIEPVRAAKIDFSPPYVFIEGTYMVRRDAPFQKAAELDRNGVRIAVGKGTAYDLYLTRTVKQAQLVRVPTSAGAVDAFVNDHLEAAAGIRQYLAERAHRDASARVLDDSFQRIEQAIGVPKGREAGAAFIRAFLEDMKASGAVRKALDATGQETAVVAPPAR